MTKKTQFFLILYGLLYSWSLFAESKSTLSSEQRAWKIFDRLNGHPPNQSQLDKISGLLEENKPLEAAMSSLESGFYSGTLLDLVSKWTSRSQSSRTVLNDFSATVIGMTRDDVPFNQVLSADILYTLNDDTLPEKADNNNNHYEQADQLGVDLMTKLTRQKQSDVTRLPEAATAGVLTTQTAGEQFFTAGTNRAVVRFGFMAFLCSDMEDMHDTTRSDHRVRRDVSRTPGGESSVYLNKCQGCHAGMDALAGAAAYYDYEPNNAGGLWYSGGNVEQKYSRDNQNFPQGYATQDDSWMNLWSEGPNADFGWDGPQQGNGLKDMGKLLTNTRKFSECMAGQALEHMCGTKDQKIITELANQFSSEGKYSMKELLANATISCQ